MLKKHIGRRRFLRGMGGAVLGLPALDMFQPRGARAAAAPAKFYSAIMMQQNGSIQGHGGDPDLFWPKALGAIDPTTMAARHGASTVRRSRAWRPD